MDIMLVKHTQFWFYFRLLQCTRQNINLNLVRRLRGKSCEKSVAYGFNDTENKQDLSNREVKNDFGVFKLRYPTETPRYRKSRFSDNAGLTHVLKSLGTSKEELTNLDDTNLPDDEEFDDTIMSSHEMQVAYDKEMIQHKNHVIKSIIEKKYFKTPPETCLLTCAAKEQILYLNHMDSAEWNPEKLAQCFPVSVQGVKKVLKCNFVPIKETARIKHDEKVRQNWKLLLSGNVEQISPVTRQLWKEGKLNLQHYGKIPSLPFKLICDNNEQKMLKEPPKGPFSSILKPYLAFKDKQLNKSPSVQSVNSINTTVSCTSESRPVKITVGESNRLVVNHSGIDVDDPDKTTYIQNDKLSIGEPSVTHDQFKKNLLRSFDKHQNKSEVSASFKEWMQNLQENKNKQQFQDIDFMENNNTYQEYVEKYKSNTIELTVDEPASKAGTGIKDSFMYDSSMGYQHPVGRKDITQQKVKIPTHLYKKDAIYKIGNCYYDDSGEFLYKVLV